MSKFLDSTLYYLETYDNAKYFVNEEEIVPNEENDSITSLMNSKNIREWVIVSSCLKDEKIIEECALKILKRNSLNRWLDFRGISSEEQLLRHVFSDVVRRKPNFFDVINSDDNKRKAQEIDREAIFKKLPMLAPLTPFDSKIEKTKFFCNQIYFKAVVATALYFARPRICLFLQNRVTPILSCYIQSNTSLSKISSVGSSFFNKQINLYFFPVPMPICMNILTLIAIERTPAKSPINRILDIANKIFSAINFYESLVDGGLLFFTYCAAIFESKFSLRTDRNGEAEDLFVREVMSYRQKLPKG